MLPSDIAFVDVETTGLSVTYDRIIEIGIVRVTDNSVTDKFSTLINPQMYISPLISQITGISKKDIKNAPLFEDVEKDVAKLLDGCVFVAHNVRFDYGFIKNEFRRCDMPFSTKMFCTAKLSRSLFPHERKHNLDAIIQRFGFVCENRHRAFDDAYLLWEFYKTLQKEFPTDILSKTIQTQLGNPSLPKGLIKEDIVSLKDTPGVYIFYGDQQTPLYIGKSKHVRSRVLSHFNGDYLSSKDMAITGQVRHIEAIYTAGELGALIKESELVKKMQPFYNRKLRQSKKVTTLIETTDQLSYKNISIEEMDERQLAAMETVLGVFPSKKAATQTLSGIAKKYILCEKLLGLEKTKTSCFAYRLNRCLGVCIQKENTLSYNMRFVQAFSEQRLKSWPFTGPVVVTEKDENGKIEQFLIHKWCLLPQPGDTLQFDYDIYKILVSFLREKKNMALIHQLRPKEFLYTE